MKKKKQHLSRAGRPRIDFSLEDLTKLCMLQCTMPEIASWFDVSLSTIEHRAGEEPEFRAAMDKGYALGRISVRRKQMQLLDEGSQTMAVWLGKQLLGQSDRQEIGGLSESGPVQLRVTYVNKPTP